MATPIIARFMAHASGVKYRDLRKDKLDQYVMHAGQLFYKRKLAPPGAGNAARHWRHKRPVERTSQLTHNHCLSVRARGLDSGEHS